MNEQELQDCLARIETLPARLQNALHALSPEHWDTPYRLGGWTVRQVVHHLADSHANAYMRFKLALTEDQPIIKPYLEEQWAELADSKILSPQVSVQWLEALHVRWVTLMRQMKPSDWKRSIFHPERNRLISLWEMVTLYAWHGDHHLAHIQLVIEEKH